MKVFKADRRKTPEETRREAEERAKKLELFVRHPPPNPPDPDDGHRRFAWPERVLFNGAGQCVGYAMPRVLCGGPLDTFIYPKDGVLPERELRVAIAREVASIVAEVHLHALSMRLGDISPANFLADAKGRVSVIDIDSAEIQSPSNGRIYLCPTRTSEYTALELIGRDLSKTRRTEEHDLFGLAVLIYQLLADGWHPFAVRHGRSVELRVVAGDCPQITGGAGRPPEAPPFGGGPDFDVGDELRALFVRAFVDGHREPRMRPRAAEWNRPLLCYEKVLRRRARRVSSRPVPRAARPRRRTVMGFLVGVAASVTVLGFSYVAGPTFSAGDVKGGVRLASTIGDGLTKESSVGAASYPTYISYYHMVMVEHLRNQADELVALIDHRIPQAAPVVADTKSFHAFMENLCRDGKELDARITSLRETVGTARRVYLQLDSRTRHYLGPKQARWNN